MAQRRTSPFRESPPQPHIANRQLRTRAPNFVNGYLAGPPGQTKVGEPRSARITRTAMAVLRPYPTAQAGLGVKPGNRPGT